MFLSYRIIFYSTTLNQHSKTLNRRSKSLNGHSKTLNEEFSLVHKQFISREKIISCYIRKKTAIATTEKYSHCCFFISLLYFISLLHNLETNTQRMGMLIPIGSEQYKLANLRRRTYMLANTWTNIVITNAYQT